MAATTPPYSGVGLKPPELVISYSDTKQPFQICSGAESRAMVKVFLCFNALI